MSALEMLFDFIHGSIRDNLHEREVYNADCEAAVVPYL